MIGRDIHCLPFQGLLVEHSCVFVNKVSKSGGHLVKLYLF